jgi:hypothetical protein
MKDAATNPTRESLRDDVHHYHVEATGDKQPKNRLSVEQKLTIRPYLFNPLAGSIVRAYRPYRWGSGVILPVAGNNFSFCCIFLSNANPYCALHHNMETRSAIRPGLQETQHELAQIRYLLSRSWDYRGHS